MPKPYPQKLWAPPLLLYGPNYGIISYYSMGWGPYNSMVLKGRDPVETPPLEEYVDIDPDDRDADAGVTPPVAEPGASAAWEPRKRISSS